MSPFSKSNFTLVIFVWMFKLVFVSRHERQKIEYENRNTCVLKKTQRKFSSNVNKKYNINLWLD